MARIRIKDLSRETKISKEEMKAVRGGTLTLAASSSSFWSPRRPSQTVFLTDTYQGGSSKGVVSDTRRLTLTDPD